MPTVRARRAVGFVATAVLVALLATAVPGGSAPQRVASADVGVRRLAGADRMDTAARIATTAFPGGAGTSLVARADDFPDALAAAGLAGAWGAPVLLTDRSRLSGATADALEQLGSSRTVLLGGPTALSNGVAGPLSHGHDVDRLSGPDRYATAAAIARELGRTGSIGRLDGRRTAFLASGEAFPDALAAAPLAYRQRFPVLLTTRDGLPADTAAALEDLSIGHVVIVGGSLRIGDAVADALRRRNLRVTRLAGPDRASTAVELADFAIFEVGVPGDRVVLARSDTFPDALAAGPLAGKAGGVILLTGDRELGEPVRRWLAQRCPRIARIDVVGGALAIPATTATAASRTAGACGSLDTAYIEYDDDVSYGSAQPMNGVRVRDDVFVRLRVVDDEPVDHVEWTLDGTLSRDDDLDPPYEMVPGRVPLEYAEWGGDGAHTVTGTIVHADGSSRTVSAAVAVGDDPVPPAPPTPEPPPPPTPEPGPGGSITHGRQIGASNTGFAGAGLAASGLTPSGSRTVDSDGTTLQGLDVDGSITIAADNVTIRNSRVSDRTGSGAIRVQPGVTGWRLEHVTITGGGVGSIGLNVLENTTGIAHRVDISQQENSARMASGTLSESYLHGTISPGGGAHRDQVEIYEGGGILIVRSRIIHAGANTSQAETATINITGDFGHVNGVTIQDSHLDGGNGTILIDDKHREAPSHLRFVGNTFGDNAEYEVFLPAGAGYDDPGTSNEVAAGAHVFLWKDNTWAETGNPARDGTAIPVP